MKSAVGRRHRHAVSDVGALDDCMIDFVPRMTTFRYAADTAMMMALMLTPATLPASPLMKLASFVFGESVSFDLLHVCRTSDCYRFDAEGP